MLTLVNNNDNSPRSYRPEVQADSTGTWAGNMLRFATAAEAETYAQDLATRWTSVIRVRVVPSPDAVTDAWIDGRLARPVPASAVKEG